MVECGPIGTLLDDKGAGRIDHTLRASGPPPACLSFPEFGVVHWLSSGGPTTVSGSVLPQKQSVPELIPKKLKGRPTAVLMQKLRQFSSVMPAWPRRDAPLRVGWPKLPVDLKQPCYGELVGSKSVIRGTFETCQPLPKGRKVSTISYAQNRAPHKTKERQRKAAVCISETLP